MKKVGIIGGAGPLASALFYETLIKESYLQAHQVPEIYLINYPFTRGITVEEGQTKQKIIQEELKYCVELLIQNQVEIGVLVCNTLHLYLKLLPQTPFHFVPLPNVVMQQARINEHRRLLILGTQNTCCSALYQHPEMVMLYPPTKDQQLVDCVIDSVLEGTIIPEDSELLGQMINRLSQFLVFDGVVLGCTDLPVLHHCFPISCVKPLYDSIKIPVKTLRGLL